MKRLLLVIFATLFTSLFLSAQTDIGTGLITGVVKDPNQAVIANTQVLLTNSSTKTKAATTTNYQGVYTFAGLQPGDYSVSVDAKGFRAATSSTLKLATGQSLRFDFALTLSTNSEIVDVSAGAVENAYRVDNLKSGGPLGTIPVVNLPYSINVISRQLIDDTQSRNFKEASKYLPLIMFQEMQGPEILRPESRGMQGTNMQNDRKDGMGFAVTTPSAMEEYEQIEAINGLAAPMYGPTQPSGIFNFVTKRPTNEQYREIELGYEGDTVATVHTDLGGRVGPNHMFGYRTNLVLGDGDGYVTDSQLRRQLASVALDVRPFAHTLVEGNFSYYNLFQHGYPGWFSYNPTISPSAKSPYTLLPVNAPDPTRQGYGQSFSGIDLNNQLSEVRVKQEFSPNWQLSVGLLNQIATRNINTAVNSLVNSGGTTATTYLASPGKYQTYLANTFSSLAPRFQVKSDLAYLTGKFKTWGVGHELVIGSTGYRFATFASAAGANSTVSALPANKAFLKTALCPANISTTACKTYTANINSPVTDVLSAAGLPSYSYTGPGTGMFVSSIIHQQGFSLGDTVTLSRHWLIRAAASQDWTWTNNFTLSSTAPYSVIGNAAAPNYMSQGVSTTASILYKPRENMTVYGTFADSLQAPDNPPVSSATTIFVNSAKALAPYRDIEGELGYKLVLRKINFSAALFRLQRPFANNVTVPDSECPGTLTATQVCDVYKIAGNQINYGAEAMLSGRIFERLMLTGGITALNAKLTDTPSPLTNNKDFVGIPAYRSNILAEYQIPVLVGAFFNFDWQHVGRRPIDDVNSTYVPQYNTFDLGFRYTAKVFGKLATWRVTANNISNVHYWSTIGPSGITGLGTSADLGHLGEPRLITASMKYNF